MEVYATFGHIVCNLLSALMVKSAQKDSLNTIHITKAECTNAK